MLPNPDFDERNKRLHNYQRLNRINNNKQENKNLIGTEVLEIINLETSRIYSELRWRNFTLQIFNLQNFQNRKCEFQFIPYKLRAKWISCLECFAFRFWDMNPMTYP